MQDLEAQEIFSVKVYTCDYRIDDLKTLLDILWYATLLLVCYSGMLLWYATLYVLWYATLVCYFATGMLLYSQHNCNGIVHTLLKVYRL